MPIGENVKYVLEICTLREIRKEDTHVRYYMYILRRFVIENSMICR
jgi:hypothetical protein